MVSVHGVTRWLECGLVWLVAGRREVKTGGKICGVTRWMVCELLVVWRRGGGGEEKVKAKGDKRGEKGNTDK